MSHGGEAPPHFIYELIGGIPGELVFMHQLGTIGRHPRLVLAFLQEFHNGKTMTDPIGGVRLWASSMTREGGFVGSRSTREKLQLRLKGAKSRVFAGQADPADHSHFTIKYEIDDQPGTIDGWLQVDDTVKLQIRDGPAKQPKE